mmetsp:Transcript_58617/g.148742  ORF Transcript_58617/g.148742 Transcript_58617/m.148742 type:complete len:238 (-) Transcript_58617:80-793(-)
MQMDAKSFWLRQANPNCLRMREDKARHEKGFRQREAECMEEPRQVFGRRLRQTGANVLSKLLEECWIGRSESRLPRKVHTMSEVLGAERWEPPLHLLQDALPHTWAVRPSVLDQPGKADKKCIIEVAPLSLQPLDQQLFQTTIECCSLDSVPCTPQLPQPFVKRLPAGLSTKGVLDEFRGHNSVYLGQVRPSSSRPGHGLPKPWRRSAATDQTGQTFSWLRLVATRQTRAQRRRCGF